LKPFIFLGGSEFRLRIPLGKLFVFQTFPLSKNYFVCNLKSPDKSGLFFIKRF